MKRFISLSLSLLGAVGVGLYADTFHLNGINYETGYTDCLARYDGVSPDVDVPAQIIYDGNKYDVKLYADFSGSEALQNVKIADGVYLDYKLSFSDCRNLKDVSLPQDVDHLDDRMFYNCPALDIRTVLTDNISYVGGEAFAFSEPTNCGSINLCSISIVNINWDEPFRNRLYEDVTLDNEVWLNSLDFSGTTRLTTNNVDLEVNTFFYRSSLEHLTEITAQDCEHLDVFQELPALEKIRLEGLYGRITILNQPNLNEISVSGITGEFPSADEYYVSSIAVGNCPRIATLDFEDKFRRINIQNMENFSVLKGCDAAVEFNMSGCKNIEKISLAGIEEIGRDSFYDNAALKEVYFGENLKHISTDGVFKKCPQLQDLVYAGSLQQWMNIDFSIDMSSPDNAMLARVPNFWYGHGNAKLTKLTEINGTHMEGMDKVPAGAFTGYSGLTKVSLPSTVEKICNSAFANCKNITDIDINVERIEQYAFLNDSGIESIKIGDNLRYIGPAFTLSATPFTVNYIGSADAWSKVTLSQMAYEDCEDPDSGSGTSLRGSAQLMKLAKDFFFNGSELEELQIDAPQIITNSFACCKTLKSVVINCGSSYPEIAASAFEGCRQLASVKYTAPKSARGDDTAYNGFVIGARAFEDCINLSEIQILDNIKSIGAYALKETAWEKAQPQGEVIYLNTELGQTAYSFSGTAPENYNLVIKEGTEAINEKAFSGDGAENGERLDNITTVELPSTLRYVADAAFDNLKLKGCLSLPASVKYFGECDNPQSNLSEFRIEDSALPISLSLFVNSVDKIYFGRDIAGGNGIGILADTQPVVVYGANVKGVNSANNVNASAIYTLALTPPVCVVSQKFNYATLSYEDYFTAFADVDFESCVLHVPADALEYYRNAPGWSEFKNIEGDANTILGIGNIANEEANVDEVHFDLSGRMIPADASGLHIVRKGNKTIKKMK